MTTRQKGYYRDKCIVDIIDEFGVLTTEQVYYLLFSNINYGMVKCRERLRILRNKDKINAVRVDINECNCFYVDRKPNKYLEHDLNRNWGYIYLLRYVGDNHKYYKFNEIRNEYVMCGNILRPDGIIGFKNYVTNGHKYFFIESDRVESNNKFVKVSNYNEIYKNKLYLNEYWFKLVDRFPHILIVCNSEKKKNKVMKIVEIDNIEYNYIENGKVKNNGLKFIVKTVDEIKLELSAI